MDQEVVDRMTALRRQGISFKAIAQRVGVSERSARRWVGKVPPQVHAPAADDAPTGDPRVIREYLLDEFMTLLHSNEELRSVTVEWTRVGPRYSECFDATYGGPPSILFLSEAEKLLRGRLEKLEPRSLKLLANSAQSKRRFLREVVGPLFSDYVGWHRFAFANPSGYLESGEDWRPPSERRGASAQFEYVNPLDLTD
jgi:hypothetical protein